jgi:hypothetical protein
MEKYFIEQRLNLYLRSTSSWIYYQHIMVKANKYFCIINWCQLSSNLKCFVSRLPN